MTDTNKKLPQPKTVETKELAKPFTDEQTLDFLKECALAKCDPKGILKRLSATAFAWYENSKPSKELRARLQEEVGEALPIIALDTHYLIAEVVGERYRPFVITFVKQLIEEYQCKTPSEKALAQNVAVSYVRSIELSNRATSMARADSTSQEKNGYYGALSKELDRAQRQFTSSLLVLKQMKSPNLEVNIKAKNAFIAQNQQVNATSPDQMAGKPIQNV
jgi:hypothetical protein